MASREGADLGADLVGELRDDDLGWMDTLDAVGAAAPRPVAKRTGYHPAADDAAGPPPPKRTKPAARTPARPLAPPGVRLAPEERARLEKERNREHARNTRARKKEALGKLRRDVAGLEEAALERDAAAEQDRQVSQRRLASHVSLITALSCSLQLSVNTARGNGDCSRFVLRPVGSLRSSCVACSTYLRSNSASHPA